MAEKANLVFFVFFTAALTPAASAETLGNQGVIALTDADVGDAALIAKIRTVPCDFDISVKGMAHLKQAGVSNTVIAEMIRRCADTPPAPKFEEVVVAAGIMRRPGFYLNVAMQGSSDLREIAPAVVSVAAAGGNGSILFPHRSRISLPNTESENTAFDARPAIYLYSDHNAVRPGGFGDAGNFTVYDPSNVKLIKFDLKSGRRIFTVSNLGVLNGLGGTNSEAAIAVTTTEIATGVYQVEPEAELRPGQYAFLEDAGNGSFRVYDFQVR